MQVRGRAHQITTSDASPELRCPPLMLDQHARTLARTPGSVAALVLGCCAACCAACAACCCCCAACCCAACCAACCCAVVCCACCCCAACCCCCCAACCCCCARACGRASETPCTGADQGRCGFHGPRESQAKGCVQAVAAGRLYGTGLNPSRRLHTALGFASERGCCWRWHRRTAQPLSECREWAAPAPAAPSAAPAAAPPVALRPAPQRPPAAASASAARPACPARLRSAAHTPRRRSRSLLQA